MNPSVLILVTGDPRTSPRPAEAVRIAAGVGSWRRVQISLYLRDAAVLLLGEDAGELMDGPAFTRYLPLIRDFGRPIYVQRGGAFLGQIHSPTLAIEEIPDTQLAALAAENQYVLSF